MESELGLTFGLCVPFFWGNTCKLHSPFPGLMVGCGPGQKAPGAAKSEWFCHFCSGIELGEWALRHSLGQLHHSTFACRSLGPGINELSSQTKWQFCRLQKLFFPRSIVIFCKMTTNDKIFHQMTKTWQTKWQFCRLQKLHFSRSIVIFLSLFWHFSNNFRWVSILLRKWRQNDNNDKIFHQMTKTWQTKWQFCRLQKLHFSRSIVIFCHCFGTFQTIFDIFPCCWENGTKMTKQRQNFHQMTQNDRPKLKWQKNNKKRQTNDRQNWNDKKWKKQTTKKWQNKYLNHLQGMAASFF